MAIFLDDILNLEFTTNLRWRIPVSVITKRQKMLLYRHAVFGAEKDEPSAKRANLNVRVLTILSEGKWDHDQSPIRPMPKLFRVAG